MMESRQVSAPIETGKNASLSVYFVLTIALASCYGNLNTLTQIAQYVPSLAIILLAFFLLFTGKVKGLSKYGGVSVASGALITLLALIGSTLSQDMQSSLYALVFLLTWVSIVIILQKYSMSELLRSFAYGGSVSVLIYIVASGFKIGGALTATGDSITIDDRSTGPFMTHPNLIAHTMAVFVILSIFQASSEKIIGKLIFYFTACLGTLIILSTSSRGGLVALVLASFIGYLIVYRANFKLILLFVLGVVFACLYVVFFNPEFIERLSMIMDLNSTQRGINSGFSGRQDLWLMVISQFFTMNIPFVWGGGFRNEWLSEFISAVDNGYIVSIAEVGFISLLVVLVRLILAMRQSVRRVRFNPNSIDATIISLVLFILAESVVARYLLAIGNAASVIVLFIIVAGAKGYIYRKT